MRRRAKWMLLLPVILLGLAHADRDADSVSNWRLASRAPVGLAPDPANTSEAVVQVYAARAAHWRGDFGVHTWIAAKPTNAPAFTVYEVTGFQVRRGGPAIRISQRSPDGRYGDSYRIWPGPNSNTFTAFVLRQVPELRVDLPAHAIGKDYLGARVFARTPSGTGAQASIFGVLGLLAGTEEGLEVNVLGLTFGLDPGDLALKLPLVGSIGLDAWDTPHSRRPSQ